MSKLYTVTVFTENRVGLLNQISIIFTRRCLNIESLSVSPSSIPGIHKFTITVWSDHSTIAKVTKQIEKRIEVLRSFFYTDDELVYQEIALYKVPTEQLLDEKELEKIIRRYNARILEMDRTFTVIEMTGHSDETSALFNDLKKYGILQFVRSGRVAVTKTDEELLNMYLENQDKRLERIEQQCSNQ
ncbi:MAG: acetolactate synthase small subunit [Candidatus Limisoma sp.]|nr:acetolactate synthase small subunit [Candidatus Limisoma sp.]MDY6106066.1 acetolactate synthase small subunit [Candidatus Limisoma sp.]